ncbi:MAG TPA: putative Ig domain-containing protein, partial [Longimicrobiales bacterium]|nr:putative Ig domain-containing protein [Longimicrobiales bacterium]
DEALLVEYRPAEGWDQELPASGILVYRHDLGAPFRPDPTGPRRYRISLVEADDDSTLVRNHGEGGNRGEAPDVFAAGGPAQILSAASRPHTRRADGSPGSVTVHEMEVVDGQARVVVSTHPTPGVVQEGGAIRLDALETASGEILLGGGALPYQVDVQGLPAGVTFVEEADRLALEGRPTEVGPFAARVTVVDATGTRASSTAELHVVLVVDLELLMHGLVEDDAGALSAERRGVLDTAGNGNGRYDAGDLRAHLLGG